MRAIDVTPNDVVFYDGEGYETLKKFLLAQGIEHVLLCGYHADMCVCSTAAGYENLRRDFNVFLVGDAVQATLPANKTARFATNQAVSFASLKVFITQVSWVRMLAGRRPRHGRHRVELARSILGNGLNPDAGLTRTTQRGGRLWLSRGRLSFVGPKGSGVGIEDGLRSGKSLRRHRLPTPSAPSEIPRNTRSFYVRLLQGPISTRVSGRRGVRCGRAVGRAERSWSEKLARQPRRPRRH